MGANGSSAMRGLSSAWSHALDVMFPPLCLRCDVPVGQDRALCPDCWSAIHFFTSPLCARCGAPFDADAGDEAVCSACYASPPPFAVARSAMAYDDASRPLVLGFKHGDRLHPATAMAGWMHRAGGASLWSNVDIIVPVPLHRWRLFRRRYNQAAVLAKALGGQTGLKVAADALIRTRPTPSQGHAGRGQRRRNVEGAFRVSSRWKAALTRKTIMLVDDVYTTGATAAACSHALLDAGVAEVRVLTLARPRFEV